MTTEYSKIFSASQDFLEGPKDYRGAVVTLGKILSRSSGVDVPWEDPDSLGDLKENDLLRVRDSALNEGNSALQEVIRPYVHRVLQAVFGAHIEYPVRVSAQIKRRWTDADLEQDSRTDSHRANFSYPTRAHQDLVNNGCRSSHTLIFYYQLTPADPRANNMEVEFPRGLPVGLYGSSDERGYVNEIRPSEQSRIRWHSPDFEPGNIYYMTCMKAHRTGLRSEIPRIALNVKIQPVDLLYLRHVYEVDIEAIARQAGERERLETLAGILSALLSANNGLSFELAVVKTLLGDHEGADAALRALFVSESPSEIELKRLLRGAFRREVVTSSDLSELSAPLGREDVTEYSCAAAVLSTVSNTLLFGSRGVS